LILEDMDYEYQERQAEILAQRKKAQKEHDEWNWGKGRSE